MGRPRKYATQGEATAAKAIQTRQAEINAAQDYLRGAAATPEMARAAATWGPRPQTFFANREVGSPNVFNATTATATAGPAPIPVSASFARAQPSNPETPQRGNARPGASASASVTPGSSWANPVSLDSDEEDEGDDKRPSPTVATATPGVPTPTRPAANRGSGRSARAVPVANADATLEIVVGEWRGSTAAPRNAVIARFDARGRLNFRIVARAYGANQPVPGPSATAAAAASIDFMGPYAGMSYEEVRQRLTQQLGGSQRLGN